MRESIAKELNRTDSRMIHLRELARSHGQNPTLSEKLLRDRLVEFRFQCPIMRFILDFFNPETAVCVEIDGPYHWNTYRKDNRRDVSLFNKLGICTLRVSNTEVQEDPDGVVERIRAWKPEPPREIDDDYFRRAWEPSRQNELARFTDGFIKLSEQRPRSDMIKEFDLLTKLSLEGLEFQTRFLKKLKDRVEYWPSDGYPVRTSN